MGDEHFEVAVRHVDGSQAGPVPVVAVCTCACGASASVHDDAHVMLWWRDHRAEPEVSAAEFATRRGIRVPTPNVG